MKSFSFAKVLTLGCVLCLSLPVACGDDETNPPAKAGSDAGGEAGAGLGGGSAADGGAGGAPALMIPGTSDAPKTVKCGSEMCSSVKTLAGLYVDPCCVADACGVSTPFFATLGAAFTNACQASAQVGDLDTACPDSPDQMVPVNGMTYTVPGFAGCCRAETGTCGVVVDDVAVAGIPLPFASPGLGCVDSAPFFNQKAGAACGAGVGGGGGAGGVGGAGAGGAPTGAGGASGGAPLGGAGGNQ
jgi:hypothetical protein